MEALTFEPLPMERVWGGRELERVYRRRLPDPAARYGESWELVDRPDQQSVVNEGPWAGRTLHELWSEHRAEWFGDGLEGAGERFPLLVKILDARDDLSLQVHPPAAVAPALGGEPKTEMWYVAAADPGAKLYAGLHRGVTREDFEQALAAGTVADTVRALQPRAGESIFIPSGRLHAIGAGLLIHEIQQNSDTTYRVFDWNRPGLDGKPRALHVAESLASIDFADFEPTMDLPRGQVLAECAHFRVEKLPLADGQAAGAAQAERFAILSLVEGELESAAGRVFPAGSLVLLPRGAAPLRARGGALALRTTLPPPGPAADWPGAAGERGSGWSQGTPGT
jgi:mannose-6-phosphate isomerase